MPTRERPPIVHPKPLDSTIKQLYGTAWRCGHPDCPKPLYRVSDTGETILNSEVAHIHARSEGGPRWNPEMTADENRAATNLIPLCDTHAREIDAIPQRYPPELLHKWKEGQLQECRDLEQSWQVNSRQVREIVEVSFDHRAFGTETAVSTAVVQAARIVGELIPTATEQRRRAATAVAGWQLLREQANWGLPVHDRDTGERLLVEPSLVSAQPHRQALLGALEAATAALRPLTTSLSAELHAINATTPELEDWCVWVQTAAAELLQVSARWPGSSTTPPYPLADNDDLVNAMTQLRKASISLTARFRGQDAESPPPPAPEQVEEPESESQREAREHRELLEFAVPWSRVATRPWDPDLYERLVDATAYAIFIPEAPSLRPVSLSATTKRAADVARNSAPDTFDELISAAATRQPVAVSALLLWRLAAVARDSGQQDLADRAQATLVAILDPSQWQHSEAWASNKFHSRSILDLTAHVRGVESVRAVLDVALAEPALLDLILAGLVTWLETRNSYSWELTGFKTTIRTLPEWVPVEALVAAIGRRYPDVAPAPDGDLDVETDESRLLAAHALRAADGPTMPNRSPA